MNLLALNDMGDNETKAIIALFICVAAVICVFIIMLFWALAQEAPGGIKKASKKRVDLSSPMWENSTTKIKINKPRQESEKEEKGEDK